MKEIIPVEKEIDLTIAMPGSKSLTQRGLIAAALSEGESSLLYPLTSEDTDYTIAALKDMGVTIDNSNPDKWLIKGCGGNIKAPKQEIYLGNNGTATRFLTSVTCLGHGDFRINGNEYMQKRPIEPLIKALRGWGADISSDNNNGCPPITIKAKGLAGGKTILPEGKSSQYLSSLLLIAPYGESQAELEVEGEIYSKPYVEMTIAVMYAFGVQIEATPQLDKFRIPKGRYRGCEYRIEGDASAASYFWAAAAISGGKVSISNAEVPSLQGDSFLVPLLARMGCEVQKEENGGLSLSSRGQLKGINAEMAGMPDVAPTLAIVAAFAEGTTTINNIAHLRIKECDRIHAVVQGLKSMGADIEEEDDRMIIHGKDGGSNLHGAEIETFDDHRMAMCFAIAGLKVAGVKVKKPECVKKSFPDFWQKLAEITQIIDR